MVKIERRVLLLYFLLISVTAIWSQCTRSWIGDGWCDKGCNTRQFKFDDGDCCKHLCPTRNRPYQCGVNGYHCKTLEQIPTWFKDDTKLCFKWRADGNGGQCGGNAPGHELCANVNQKTANYRDDTDRRSGGCRMQWGLRSPYAPAWFRDNVKICYRWYPDGDGGQCGGGAARLLCSTPDGFSSEYRDDTDRRGGGCRMSWMLQIPRDAPLWLRDVTLCYYWHPDGNGGQCGGGVGRQLCARANHWTTYYRDDTDGRPGGCQMSWGLRLPS